MEASPAGSSESSPEKAVQQQAILRSTPASVPYLRCRSHSCSRNQCADLHICLLTKSDPTFRNSAAHRPSPRWLGLCPDNDISGGKILSVRTRKVSSRAPLAFRMADALFAGNPGWVATIAACAPDYEAPKPSRRRLINWLGLSITCLQLDSPTTSQIFAKHEQASRARTEARLRAQAKELGLQLLPV